MADPVAVVVPAPKPGYATTEFWFHIAIGAAIWFLSSGFDAGAAGLPPIAAAGFLLVKPIALAWLAKSYGDTRADTKSAAIKGALAAGAVNTDAEAVAVAKAG